MVREIFIETYKFHRDILQKAFTPPQVDFIIKLEKFILTKKKSDSLLSTFAPQRLSVHLKNDWSLNL